jgi:RNA-binding protein YlmH
MEEVKSLEGPVLKVNGELVLFLPLSAGGDELIELSRAISEVEGEFIRINIPVWLAAVLRIEEGDLVTVHKAGGLFRIGPSEPRHVH